MKKKKNGKTRQAKIKKVQIFHKSLSLGESLLDVPICVCMHTHTCLHAYLFRTMGSSCPYFVICNLLFTYQGLNAFNCHLALFIPPPQVSPPAFVSCLWSFTKWHPKSTQPRSVGNTEDFSSYPTEAVVICALTSVSTQRETLHPIKSFIQISGAQALTETKSLLSSLNLKIATVSMKLENSIATANVNSTGKKGM